MRATRRCTARWRIRSSCSASRRWRGAGSAGCARRSSTPTATPRSPPACMRPKRPTRRRGCSTCSSSAGHCSSCATSSTTGRTAQACRWQRSPRSPAWRHDRSCGQPESAMQSIDISLEPLRALLAEVGSFMPRLAIALVVVVGGWLIAKAIRLGVVKTLGALNFHVLAERAGIDGFLQQGGTDKDTTALVGWLAYLAVILGALIVACNGLGLTQVTELLGRVLLFVPRLLVALAVIVLGSYFARFVRDVVSGYCRDAGISDGELLGRLVQYGALGGIGEVHGQKEHDGEVLGLLRQLAHEAAALGHQRPEQ